MRAAPPRPEFLRFLDAVERAVPAGKLAKSPERHWHRLNGLDRLTEIIRGVRFRGGAPMHEAEDQAAA